MIKILFKIALLFFFTFNIANANLYTIRGLNFYEESDDTPWFKPQAGKDLINLDKIGCQTSKGKKTKCKLSLSPMYNFPKDTLFIQNKIVRSGKYAWKFINGEGDCGQRRNGDDCKQNRERSEVSMSPPKSKETWFKFSIFIPEESEFTVPISNTIWQVHSQKGPPKFMFVISPNGDLQWQDFVNNSFGGFDSYKILDAKYLKGKWNDFIVNIEFVKWPNQSFIKVWVNNKQIVNYVGMTNNNMSNKPYMKFGIYKSNINRFETLHKGNPPKRGDTIIYYDSIVIGKKCKDLNLEEENNSCNKLK